MFTTDDDKGNISLTHKRSLKSQKSQERTETPLVENGYRCMRKSPKGDCSGPESSLKSKKCKLK